jgi:copper(I)-binding protein
VLTILNAKNEKDRLVPMSDSLADRCRLHGRVLLRYFRTGYLPKI